MLPAFNIDSTGADAKCGIYALRRVDKLEVYIGQSIDVYERLRDHKKCLKNGRHRNARLKHIYGKYGANALAPAILAVGFDPLDKDLLTLAEQEFMDAAKDGLLNLAPAAASMLGYRHSAETRVKMQVTNKGKKPFGVPVSEERRAKLRTYRLGVPSPWKGQTHTAETRAHISKVRQAQIAAGMPSGFKGRQHTEESRAKLSAAKKGRPSPNRGVPRTAEATAKQSETMKRLHASPEFQEKMRALNAQPERRAARKEAQKRAWITRKAAMENK